MPSPASTSDNATSGKGEAVDDPPPNATDSPIVPTTIVQSVSSKRTEVASKIIAALQHVPLRRLVVDKQFSNGGLRQRALRRDAESAHSIRRLGWDNGLATMVCIEVGYSDEEWKKELELAGLPAGTKQPPKLMDTIERNQWGSLETIDFRKLSTIERLRKFIMVDGNHRIWVLQNLLSGDMKWECSDADAVVPETIGFIRLMEYDPDRPEV
jgi:hypothetical protein